MNNSHPIMPVKDYIQITQGYNPNHHALDFGHRNNGYHEIIACKSGTVTKVVNNYETQDSTGSSYGNQILVDCGDSTSYRVAHLKYGSCRVNVGDYIAIGTVIALMGTTGHSTGIHCHFEYMINGNKVNPLEYVYLYTSQEEGSYNVEYSIMRYSGVEIVPNVARDENKNQIETKEKMNVRDNYGINSSIIGTVPLGNIYDFYDNISDGQYTWYLINASQWVANDSDGNYLTVYNAVEKEDEEMIEKLTNELKEAYEKIDIQNSDIIQLEKTIDELVKKIDDNDKNTILNYKVLKDNDYIIALKNGQDITIKKSLI